MWKLEKLKLENVEQSAAVNMLRGLTAMTRSCGAVGERATPLLPERRVSATFRTRDGSDIVWRFDGQPV